jgi:hypothetical protein
MLRRRVRRLSPLLVVLMQPLLWNRPSEVPLSWRSVLQIYPRLSPDPPPVPPAYPSPRCTNASDSDSCSGLATTGTLDLDSAPNPQHLPLASHDGQHPPARRPGPWRQRATFGDLDAASSPSPPCSCTPLPAPGGKAGDGSHSPPTHYFWSGHHSEISIYSVLSGRNPDG